MCTSNIDRCIYQRSVTVQRTCAENPHGNSALERVQSNKARCTWKARLSTTFALNWGFKLGGQKSESISVEIRDLRLEARGCVMYRVAWMGVEVWEEWGWGMGGFQGGIGKWKFLGGDLKWWFGVLLPSGRIAAGESNHTRVFVYVKILCMYWMDVSYHTRVKRVPTYRLQCFWSWGRWEE